VLFGTRCPPGFCAASGAPGRGPAIVTLSLYIPDFHDRKSAGI
jgi:hypothetical protein